jgi:hypothetical protein
MTALSASQREERAGARRLIARRRIDARSEEPELDRTAGAAGLASSTAKPDAQLAAPAGRNYSGHR